MLSDIRPTSIDPEIYARQLEANRAEPSAYRGRGDLNKHVPKWTYPLVTRGDYDRLSDWIARCNEHGLDEVTVVL
jgi:hypothetical protein